MSSFNIQISKPQLSMAHNWLRRWKCITAIAVALVAGPLWACQVPVFRYALERWSADQYRVVVLHSEPLDAAAQEALQRLRAAAKENGPSEAIDLKVINLGENEEETKTYPVWTRIWNQQSDTSKPLMLVFYPSANDVGRSAPMYEDELSTENVAKLLDSPVRRKLTKRLEAGDSAVWIFVPSGNEEADSVALTKLRQQTAADAKWLELPSAEELEVDAQVLESTKVPLKIHFSILILNRDDEAEQFLLQSLLNSEPDLVDFDQPLAFPVFGQGRVLYALVGQGIAQDTIRTASSFMAGPCSCQVKNQNPGFDLLLKADWAEVLGDVLISEPIDTPNQEALTPKLLTIPPGRSKR